MKSLLLLLFILANGLFVSAQETIYVDACENDVNNGPFALDGLLNGKKLYRAQRSYSPGYVSAPQTIFWNPSANSGAGRWELTNVIFGYAQVIIYNNNSYPTDETLPAETGWEKANQFVCSADVRVYIPQNAVSGGGNWSNPATWSIGSVPEKYDNVTIAQNTTLDVDATIYNLTLPYSRTLSGAKVLTVLGDALAVPGVQPWDMEGSVSLLNLVMAGKQAQNLSVMQNGAGLTINNPAGVHLGALVGHRYGFVVDMQAGHLFVGDKALQANEVIGKASAYVVTNGTGRLSLVASASTAYDKTFHIGKSTTSYSPVRIQKEGSAYDEFLGMNVRVGSMAAHAPHSGSVDLLWDITRTAQGSPVFTVDFTWNEQDQKPLFDRSAALQVKRYDGTSWYNVTHGTQTLSGGNPYTVRKTNIDQFSAWGIFNTNDPLPVTLTSFAADKEESFVRLAWETTSETNSKNFMVEHSRDGKSWLRIGEVAAHGGSEILRSYFFVDNSPLAGVNYYRLKMTDLDGTFEYSTIKSVRFEVTVTKSKVFPNPVSDRFFLEVDDRETLKSVQLLNIAGHRVGVLSSRSVDLSFDMGQLPAGIYLLRVDYKNGTGETHRVVIEK